VSEHVSSSPRWKVTPHDSWWPLSTSNALSCRESWGKQRATHRVLPALPDHDGCSRSVIFQIARVASREIDKSVGQEVQAHIVLVIPTGTRDNIPSFSVQRANMLFNHIDHSARRPVSLEIPPCPPPPPNPKSYIPNPGPGASSLALVLYQYAVVNHVALPLSPVNKGHPLQAVHVRVALGP
jgi:hypothetical protein